jgi:type IV secretory pathway VirB4 component
MTKSIWHEVPSKLPYNTGNLFINIEKTIIIMITETNEFDDARFFTGTVLMSTDKDYHVGQTSTTFHTSDYQPFYGKITLEQ